MTMESKSLEINGRTYTVFEDGKIIGPSGKELKWNYTRDGYPRVSIGKAPMLVHRLVALAFVPNPNNYNEVDHIDGNKNNPSASNLEWVSHQENVRRAAARGSYAGEKSSRAKLNRYEIIFIREAAKLGIKRKELANQFNITQRAIDYIITGRNWKCIA